MSKNKEKTPTGNDANTGKHVETYLKSLTPQQWLQLAPASVGAAVQNAMKVEKEARHAIVAKLVANISDDAKKQRATQRYLKMTLSELQDLEPVATQTRNQKNEDGELSEFMLYMGAQGGPTGNASNGEDKPITDDPPMEMPTLNYDDLSPVGRALNQQRQTQTA